MESIAPISSLSAIALAGGKSLRMESPRALLHFDAGPLICHIDNLVRFFA